MLAGEKVRAIRTAKKMSMDEFAVPLKISSSYVSMIESGKRNLGYGLEELLIAKYGVSKAWWTTGQGQMFRPSGEPNEKTPPESMEGVLMNLVGAEMSKLSTSGEKFEFAAELLEFLRKRRG